MHRAYAPDAHARRCERRAGGDGCRIGRAQVIATAAASCIAASSACVDGRARSLEHDLPMRNGPYRGVEFLGTTILEEVPDCTRAQT